MKPPNSGNRINDRLQPVWPPGSPEVEAALARVYRSGDWGRYHGDECSQLCAELAAMHENRDVTLCSSGTIAVELALRSVGVAADDEVILAGYDFPGNFRAVEAIGARPVLADLAHDSWTICPDAIEQATSDRVKAVIVSHLHGTTADMDRINAWSEARGIQVIEDACQTPGAHLSNGRIAGTLGDVGVLSFGGSKLLTAGRGGALLCRTKQQSQRVRVFAERGNEAFPLSELQAAVLRAQLPLLAERNKVRAQRAKQLYAGTAKVTELCPPRADAASAAAFYKLGWWVDSRPNGKTKLPTERSATAGQRRNELSAGLRSAGLAIDAGFRGFVKRSEKRCRRVGQLKNSQRAAEQTLILHHPVLLQSAETIDEVAEIICSVAGQK